MRRVASLGLLLVVGCYAGKNDPNGGAGLDSGAEGQGETGGTDDAPIGATDDETGSGAGATTSGDAPVDTGDGALPDADDGTEPGDESTGGGDDGGSDGSGSTGEPLQGCDALGDALLLCDDFDAGLDVETVWATETANGGSVAVEDGMLHVTLPSGDGARGFIDLQDGQAYPIDGNHVFGRVWVRFDNAVPNTHSYMINSSGALDGSQARYRLDVNGGRLNSRYTHTTVEQHGGWRKLGLDAVADTWVCYEWEHDGSTNSMRYWFDGELDLDMEVDGAVEDPPWVAPVFDNFELGFHTYQAPTNSDTFDIWFDDLVIATERIGC